MNKYYPYLFTTRSFSLPKLSVKILPVVFFTASSLLLTSCGGVFGPYYRKLNSATVTGPANPYPVVSRSSASGHTSRLRSYQRRGYVPLGESTITARHKVSEDEARQLAVSKNGDVAVLSTKYLGERSQRVSVPVTTTIRDTRYVQGGGYANNRGYRSQYGEGGARQSQETTYVHQNQKYKLWRHKVTVLAKRSRLSQ